MGQLISSISKSILNSLIPFAPKPAKKLNQVERAGGDIGKVLQRYLFALTVGDEKLNHVMITYGPMLPLPSK
jgi:hypothetical protein